MKVLDDSVRLVNLQFSFSNPGVIPASVKRLKRETNEEREARKSRVPGVQIIPPTENSSVNNFPRRLEEIGYEIVDAFYKERLEMRTGRIYYMVRFVFARSEHARPSAAFRSVRDAIRTDLQNICSTATWRVRVFDNPFYMDDEDSEERAISINLEVRVPLCRPDGQPIKEWAKDAMGFRVGNAPVSISPRHYLTIDVDDRIDLVSMRW